jgi:hypothetical protein
MLIIIPGVADSVTAVQHYPAGPREQGTFPPAPSPVPAHPLPTRPLPSPPGPPQPAQPRRRRPSGSFERRRAGAPSTPAHCKRYFHGPLPRWHLHCGTAAAAGPIPPHGLTKGGSERSTLEGIQDSLEGREACPHVRLCTLDSLGGREARRHVGSRAGHAGLARWERGS